MRARIERLFSGTILILIGLVPLSISSVYIQKLFLNGNWAVKYIMSLNFMWMAVVFIHLGIITVVEKGLVSQRKMKVIGAILAAVFMASIAVNLFLNPDTDISISFGD